MTSLKFCALHMHLPVNLLQSYFIDVKPSTRSKSLNKMACGDSGNRETPNMLQMWVSSTSKCCNEEITQQIHNDGACIEVEGGLKTEIAAVNIRVGIYLQLQLKLTPLLPV